MALTLPFVRCVGYDAVFREASGVESLPAKCVGLTLLSAGRVGADAAFREVRHFASCQLLKSLP